MADKLMEGGIDIVSGGTENHLCLADLRPKGVTGKAAEASLGRAHITCNKNSVPFDPTKPFVTSGIRLALLPGRPVVSRKQNFARSPIGSLRSSTDLQRMVKTVTRALRQA